MNKNESNAEDEDEDEGGEDNNMYSDDNASMINQDDTKPYNFIITNDGGYFEAITNLLSGDQIFELYQHLVLDPTHDNTQIGTYQGYGFNFPNNTHTNNDIMQGNHELFLKGGYLSVFNEIIVAADGEYTKYSGGRLHKTIMSSKHVFVTQITLVAPPSTILKRGRSNPSSLERERSYTKSDVDQLGCCQYYHECIYATLGFYYNSNCRYDSFYNLDLKA